MKKPIAIDKLRAHLAAHGLTQRDFAVSIDVSGANLSQILSCRNSPSPRTIVAIEDATQGAIVLRDWVKYHPGGL